MKLTFLPRGAVNEQILNKQINMYENTLMYEETFCWFLNEEETAM